MSRFRVTTAYVSEVTSDTGQIPWGICFEQDKLTFFLLKSCQYHKFSPSHRGGMHWKTHANKNKAVQPPMPAEHLFLAVGESWPQCQSEKNAKQVITTARFIQNTQKRGLETKQESKH